MAPLLELLKTGFYWLKLEEAELKDRAKQKEQQDIRKDTCKELRFSPMLGSPVFLDLLGVLLRPRSKRTMQTSGLRR